MALKVPPVRDVVYQIEKVCSRLRPEENRKLVLQVSEIGGWSLLDGDKCEMLDYKNYWGSVILNTQQSKENLAKDLVQQVLNHYWLG